MESDKSAMSFRTDENYNPCAFTTDIAHEAGLAIGVDYAVGTQFPPLPDGSPSPYFTAKLLGDPVQTSIRVIDAIGYYTRSGGERWTYIAVPKFVWNALTPPQQRDVIGFHYEREGGTAMRGLFPNYGKG
jgi:hypothetical protein